MDELMSEFACVHGVWYSTKKNCHLT